MTKEIKIIIDSNVDICVYEELEDKIRYLLEQEGLEGTIEDSRTGNTIMTRKEEIGQKRYTSDKSVRGVLVLGDKIWFNDDLRCRLRICGWTKEQQEKLRKSRLVDLTLINHGEDDDIANVVIDISQFQDKDVNEEKNKIREKEKELVYRINRLDKKGMRAALYSINDMRILDDIVTVGENLEKSVKKINDE